MSILILALTRPDPRWGTLVASADEIKLQPLTPDQMDRLVRGAVVAAPEPLLEAIRADGGGIPLFAVETLRELADRGVLAVDDGRYVVRGELGEVSVPPTINALVSARLDRLSYDERRILSAGAVLGESFTVSAAASVAGTSEPAARAVLDGLTAKALIAFDRDPRSQLRGRFTFIQGAVRRVTLGRLSRRERKQRHLAAVEFLAARRDVEPDLEAMLAGHLLAAVEADPKAADAVALRGRASSMLFDAAERAAGVAALEEALSRFDRAAELVTDEGERAAILERAGIVAYRAGESEAAAERYRAAQALHERAGRRRDCLRVRAREMGALSLVRPPSELLPTLRALYGELGGRGDRVKAMAGNILAFTLYQSGSHEEALAVASEAAELAEECGDWGELVHSLNEQATALIELEQPQEAVTVGSRALTLAAQHDQRRVAPLAGNLALTFAAIGKYREAVPHAEEAIATARRGAERFFERWAVLVLGRALCSLGEWDRAIAEIESVAEHVAPFYLGMAIEPLVVIALARGQRERVAQLLAEYDRRVTPATNPIREGDFPLRSAVLALEKPDALAELARLIDNATIAAFTEWSGWLAPVVDHLVAGCATQPLSAALTALQRPSVMKETPPVRAQALRLEGHLAARAGDGVRARSCFTEALKLTRLCDAAFESAVLELERAECAPGTRELGDARATFVRLRATPWVERVDTHMTLRR